MYIGEKFIETNVNYNLVKNDFYNNVVYRNLLKECTERVTHWIESNSILINTLNTARHTSYGARQIAYTDCGISVYIGKIQRFGCRVYKAELRKQVTEALAGEYNKLPEFARKTYSLDDYVESFVTCHMEKNKNQINREISAHAYNEMRRILDRALW